MSDITGRFIQDGTIEEQDLAPALKFQKFTFSYSDFSDPGIEKTLTLLSIPSAIVEYIIIYSTVEFLGGLNTTVTAEIGNDVSTPNDLVPPGNIGPGFTPLPIQFYYFPAAGLGAGIYFAPRTLAITLRTDVSNDTLTQGSLDVYIKYSALS